MSNNSDKPTRLKQLWEVSIMTSIFFSESDKVCGLEVFVLFIQSKYSPTNFWLSSHPI